MKVEALLDSLMERKYVRGIAQAIPDRPVVLIGSWARRTRSFPSSDVDLLVIDTTAPKSPPANVQVLTIAPAEFEERAKRGDELAQWALRFGVPLSGGREWRRLGRTLLPDIPFPTPKANRARAIKRLKGAEALLQMGDHRAARDELVVALSQTARAELLHRGVFPLSRPELSAQLSAVGDEALAKMLHQVSEPQLSTDDLATLVARLKERLS